MHLLEEIEFEIAKVKEEAFRRKEILDKVEKWFGACEEECWLEEYNWVDHFSALENNFIYLVLSSISLCIVFYRMKLVIMPDEVHILL